VPGARERAEVAKRGVDKANCSVSVGTEYSILAYQTREGVLGPWTVASLEVNAVRGLAYEEKKAHAALEGGG